MMRQKLGVALAVVALTLSGAREATEQFRQLKSLAGGWADTNAWNSLLVYAAGTFDGLAPQRQTALVASNAASCGDAKASRTRRAVRQAARRPARVKVETAEPVIAELALSHVEGVKRRSEVEEFRIEVTHDAAKSAMIVPRFSAADFETEVAREAGADAARAELALGMPKLFGRDFVLRFTQVETSKGRAARRRQALRRKVDERRVEATDAERDAGAQEILFEAPSDSGLLNCDDEPRR
jgi:hypothetical protein